MCRLRELGIGVGLPRKRTRRGGRRKQRQIEVVISNRNESRTFKPKDKTTSTVNFQNLIYPVHVGLPVGQPTFKQHSELSLALFNAQSVGSPEKETEITTFLRDFDIDGFLRKPGFEREKTKLSAATLPRRDTACSPFPVHLVAAV